MLFMVELLRQIVLEGKRQNWKLRVCQFLSSWRRKQL